MALSIELPFRRKFDRNYLLLLNFCHLFKLLSYFVLMIDKGEADLLSRLGLT